MTDVKLLLFYSITWNYLTVCKEMINSKKSKKIIRIKYEWKLLPECSKMSRDSLENVINKMCIQIIYK